jgi:hypothetical protein
MTIEKVIGISMIVQTMPFNYFIKIKQLIKICV